MVHVDPFTEEDAETRYWPCHMCDHDVSLGIDAGRAWAEAYRKFCHQCNRATARTKPSEFELRQAKPS